MSRRLPGKWWTALACALVVGGCSAAPETRSGGHAGAAASGVRLSPNPAFVASRIDVVFDDPRVDPAKFRYRWKRDGAAIAGASGNTLGPSHVTKGHRISVEVSFEDPSTRERRELSAEVEVENTPPRVAGAELTLSASSGTTEVRAHVESADPDGDAVSHQYRWFKNDALIDGASGPSLTAASLARGDRVAVEVVANDGESTSPPVRSQPIEIGNRPPQISSQPVAPRASDPAFRYQIAATDPDGDGLRYELVSGPLGMTIEPQGMVVWPLPPQNQRQGEHPVRIKVTDAKGGEAVQEFSVRFDLSAATQ